MHISFYALLPLFGFAAVGIFIILDRIREDINMRWHGHCRKLFEFGFDQAKIGNEKYSYSRSHRDLLELVRQLNIGCWFVQQKCAPPAADNFFGIALEFADRNFFQFLKIQIPKIFGKPSIWHNIVYTVIKLVEGLTYMESRI